MNGSQQVEQYRQAGFSEDEIGKWMADERSKFSSAGFGEQEINDWFGQREPNMKPIEAAVRETFKPANATPAEPKKAMGFDEVLQAGFQRSTLGLAMRGKVPDKVVPEDAPFAERIAGQVATMVGDVPAMVAGAFIGGAAGAPTGPGAAVTAAGGAFALPAGLRATLMDAYSKGEFTNFGDFWERSSGILWETVKGEVTGMATAAAGAGATAALPVAASTAAKVMAPTAAEIGTMVTVGKALEGEVPQAQDFLDAAVLLGGAKASMHVAGKLRETYAKTGTTPQEVAQAAEKDPTVLPELIADNHEVPEVFEPLPDPQRPSLSDPDYRAELAAMREETGWAERGGYMIREAVPGEDFQTGDVVGRTKWVPRSDWWEGRPPGLSEAKVKRAIDKALAGEKLGVREQRTIDYMLGWARDVMVEPARAMDEAERADLANDLAAASLDARPSNFRDVDAVARAAQHDEAAIERAALQFENDRTGFMAAVRAINDRAEAADRGAETSAGGQSRGKTPREQAADQAALEAEASVRELSDRELAGVSGGQAPPGSIAARPAASPEPNPAQQAVLDRVSVGESTERAYTWDKFYTDVKDELYPIKTFTDVLRGEDSLATSADPYKLARLTRGVAGKADQFLLYSPFKFDTYENVGRPLKAIIDPVKNDLDGLRSFMVAKRALELDRRGIETGVPKEEAQRVVREGGKYAPIFAEILEYQEHTLAYLADSGMLSKDAVAAMREANKDYVPFFRLMGAEEGGSGGAGTGLSVRSPVKKIKGSERKIVDPLESIIKNTYLYTTLAERNAVGVSLVELAEASGRTDLVKKVDSTAKPVTVQAEELQKFMDAHGLEGRAEDFNIFRKGYQTPAENEIVVFRDGKRELYELPRDVAGAFKALDRESAGMLTRIMAIPAKTLRAGATLAPDFMLRNFTRDQIMATINSDSGYVPVLDFMRGMFSVAKKDGDFQAWLKSGGANATLISMDRQYLQQRLAEIAGIQDVQGKAWNVVKSPIEALRVASELVENATRVGEFKRAGGGEGDKAQAQEAGMRSREVTLDFARIGAKTRAVNMITAFWNAQLEGGDRMVRAFKDNPMRTSVRVGAMITLPSVLLWLSNHDDPRWKEIPDWERDQNWIVMTQDHVFKIPKPFEPGVTFGSLVERLLDKFKDDKPEAFNHFASSMMNTFGLGMMPTAAGPVVEQMTNHSFFRDRPLIPTGLEKLLPEYQYSEYTTETTKALGQLIGSVPYMHDKSAASPMVIDNYIRGWSGTLGNYALQVADAGLRKAGVLPDPVKPAATLADIPAVKAFVVRYPSAQAQSIQNFNEQYLESKKVVDTVHYLAQRGDVANAMKEMTLDPGLMLKLDGIHEALSKSQRVIQYVNLNPDATPDEKRQLIDTTYMQMIEMARAGNDGLRDLRKAMKAEH